MKNITTIKKTAFASKIVCASKIALATILLGFLFVGWGAASLQAQERKQAGLWDLVLMQWI